MNTLKGLRIFLTTVVVLLFMPGRTALAQAPLQAGEKVYVSLAGNEEHARDVKEEVVRQLRDWGHWKLVASRKDADRVLTLEVQTHRGMTAWSWGGVTVKASARLENAEGEIRWQSKTYKANPNGTNGFNSARATAGKIVNELQKRFK